MSGSATTSPGRYKGQRADLDAAFDQFDQLRQYSLALENPPAADRVRHGRVEAAAHIDADLRHRLDELHVFSVY